jgi:hypothetical protein
MSDKGSTSDVGASEAWTEPKRFLPPAGSAEASIKVFQALQLGHLPIQRALVPPHSVQVNIDLSLAISRKCA